MRAAVLREYGATPELEEVDEPGAGDGEAVVDIEAAGLNPVDLGIASGSFWGGSPELPYTVGREGVGRLEDGRRVYFEHSVPPHGSMAEKAVAREDGAFELADELDAGMALFIGIAGLAGWLAVEWRAGLREGETVLVLGATGIVGQVALQAARLLGAGRIVAAGREAAALERASELGAHATVALDADELTAAFREAAGGDLEVVIDPLWGRPAEAAAAAMARQGRFVHLGQSAGTEATFSSSVVRGRGLSILGYNNGLVPTEVRRAAYERMARHAAAGELRGEVERLPLERIADAWALQTESPGRKLVIEP